MAAGNYDEIVENGKYVNGNKSAREEAFWYNELQYLDEVKAYILRTYEQHYVGSKFQSLDAIFESGNGPGFCIGNIQKLAYRYGKKNGYSRLDLLKILHYGILMLFCHDQNVRDGTVGENSVGTRSPN